MNNILTTYKFRKNKFTYVYLPVSKWVRKTGKQVTKQETIKYLEKFYGKIGSKPKKCNKKINQKVIVIIKNEKIKEFRIVANAILGIVKIGNPFTGKTERINNDNKVVKFDLPRIDELEKNYKNCEKIVDKKQKTEYEKLLKLIKFGKKLSDKSIKSLIIHRCDYKFNTGLFIGLNKKGLQLFIKTFKKSGLHGLDSLIKDFKKNPRKYEEYVC